MCRLLVCDFDGGCWALDALAFLDRCHGAGVPAVLERSRSGDGAHVCVFFEQSVAATVARAMGMCQRATEHRIQRSVPTEVPEWWIRRMP